MKLKVAVFAAMLGMSSSTFAGNFVTLTSGVGGILSVANGGLQNGSSNQNSDRFYIESLASSTYLSGLGYNNLTGDVVASRIDYRTFSGGTTTSTGSLTLLDWRVTTGVDLSASSPDQFDVYDFVYRDSADNKLVFASRFLNRQDNGEEANFLYRAGATLPGSAAPSVAWTRSTDDDLRMYESGLTSSTTFSANVGYNENVVRQKSDISVTEGNPWTGLYLVKTDATNYALRDDVLSFFQAGEEGQLPAGASIRGFAAFAPPAPVPEPETYAMFLAGLGIMSAVARRRKQQAS